MTPKEIQKRIEKHQKRNKSRQKKLEIYRREKKEISSWLREREWRLFYAGRLSLAFKRENRGFITITFSIRSLKDQFSRPIGRKILKNHIQNKTHQFNIFQTDETKEIITRAANFISSLIAQKDKRIPSNYSITISKKGFCL